MYKSIVRLFEVLTAMWSENRSHKQSSKVNKDAVKSPTVILELEATVGTSLLSLWEKRQTS
jgi:hypothetical protein